MNPREPEMQDETNMVELIAAIRAGDRQAFTTLYELTSQEVYRTARAILRDEEAALDVQQDTYVFAYTHLNQLSDPEKLRPWLRSIAVNRAKSVLRKQSPVLFTELENEEGEGLAEQADLSPEASPELSLERKETAELVNEILAELSDGQRAAVAMYYYEQMTVPEIAEALGVSVSTVKNQLARGKKKIEEAVRALEKKGLRLYGLSPVPFLLALMKRQSFAARQGEAVLTKTLTRTGLAAGAKSAAAAGVKATAAAAEPVAVHVGRSFFETGVGKLLVGALSVAIVGGGMWAGAKLLERNEPAPYQPTEYSERLESRETHESVHPADSAENLNDDTNEDMENWPEEGVYSGPCGESLTWSYDPERYTLTIEGSGDMEDFRYTVAPWDNYSESLRTVILPEGLTSIGEGAFLTCLSLESLTIPSSVTKIGFCALDGCNALTCIQVAEDNRDYCSVDGVLFDKSMTELLHYPAKKPESVYVIPDGVKSIPAGAFYLCLQLERVEFPDSLTSIKHYAFEHCRSLKSVSLGNGVKEITGNAFSDCPSLESVWIPKNVQSIESYAFDASAMKEIQVAADNPYYCSEDGVLFNKSKTKLLQYPAGKQDASYEIPDGVTRIAESAFAGCSALTSVTIPASVESIAWDFFAFAKCDALTEYRVAEDNPNYSSEDGVLFNKDKTILLKYPNGRQETSYTIPDSVIRIGSNAFNDCDKLSELTIPDGVKEIGSGVFEECYALTSVTIPASVTSFGSNVFESEPYDELTIYGAAGSAAQAYAEENGIAFAVLD